MPDAQLARRTSMSEAFAAHDLTTPSVSRSKRPQKSYQGPEIIIDGPAPEPVDANINDAIAVAPPAELRSLLRAIITQNPAVNDLVVDRLLLPIPGSTDRKQMAFATCANCSAQYEIRRNEMGCCVYHKGPKDIDDLSDLWKDAFDGEPAALIDVPEFQRGFYWVCCNQNGDAKGCVIARHSRQEDPDRRNFRRPEEIEALQRQQRLQEDEDDDLEDG